MKNKKPTKSNNGLEKLILKMINFKLVIRLI